MAGSDALLVMPNDKREAKLPKSMTVKKRPRDDAKQDAVSKAAAIAAALVAQRDEAIARRAAKAAKLAKSEAAAPIESAVEEIFAAAPEDDDDDNDDPADEPPTTANLNAACAKAKAAHKAAPQDEALKAAYEAAKAAFRAFQKAAVASEVEHFTCDVCQATFPLHPGAREAHMAGKKHKRKAAAAALAAAKTADEQKAIGFWSCRLCQCTGALASKRAHFDGAKHTGRLAAINALWAKGELKKGDWVCVKHGLFVQHNYATKAVCRRGTCDGTREEGVSFEAVRELAQQSRRDERSQAQKPKEAVVVGDAGVELACRDCSTTYSFSVKEQRRYQEKGYAQPTRCPECRKTKRAAAPPPATD